MKIKNLFIPMLAIFCSPLASAENWLEVIAKVETQGKHLSAPALEIERWLKAADFAPGVPVRDIARTLYSVRADSSKVLAIYAELSNRGVRIDVLKKIDLSVFGQGRQSGSKLASAIAEYSEKQAAAASRKLSEVIDEPKGSTPEGH